MISAKAKPLLTFLYGSYGHQQKQVYFEDRLVDYFFFKTELRERFFLG